jgi:hypothetical protein
MVGAPDTRATGSGMDTNMDMASDTGMVSDMGMRSDTIIIIIIIIAAASASVATGSDIMEEGARAMCLLHRCPTPSWRSPCRAKTVFAAARSWVCTEER